MILFDLIITAYNSGDIDFEQRCNNLLISLRSIPQNVHVIIIEQKSSNLPTFIDFVKNNYTSNKDNITFHKINYRGPFFKSWLYNYAAKNLSKTKHIIFGETDVLFPENYFKDFKNYIVETGDEWALGWTKLIYLTKDNKIMAMPPVCVAPMDNGKGCFGMALYVNKNLFAKIGGYNEFLQGASLVDCDIAARLIYSTQGIVNKFSSTIQHLYHNLNRSKISWGLWTKERLHYLLDNPDFLIIKLSKVFDESGSDIPLFYKKPGYIDLGGI